MNDNRRIHRIEREIQQLISGYVLTHLRDQTFGFVSVNRVTVSRDLRTGKVYISAFGDNADIVANVRLLQEHAPELQGHINQNLRMKFCPRLTFYVDELSERLMRIESELAGLKKDGDGHGSLPKPDVGEDA